MSPASAAREAAAAGTKAAGRAIGAAARRAKGPLLVGGAALAGTTGALAVRKRRSRSRVPGWLPVRDGRIDLDSVAAAGQRIGSLGQQVADIARAVQGTRGDPRRGG